MLVALTMLTVFSALVLTLIIPVRLRPSRKRDLNASRPEGAAGLLVPDSASNR